MVWLQVKDLQKKAKSASKKVGNPAAEFANKGKRVVNQAKPAVNKAKVCAALACPHTTSGMPTLLSVSTTVSSRHVCWLLHVTEILTWCLLNYVAGQGVQPRARVCSQGV